MSEELKAENAMLRKELFAMQDVLDNVQGEANLEEIQFLNTKLEALQAAVDKVVDWKIILDHGSYYGDDSREIESDLKALGIALITSRIKNEENKF